MSLAPFLEVVFCVDYGYRQHLAATVASVLQHRPQGTTVRAWVLTDEASGPGLQAFAQSWCPPGLVWAIRPWSLADLPKVPTGSHMSDVTNLRLRLGSCLPTDISRILYLDADLIVCSDLTPLWEAPLSPAFPLAAVLNAGTQRALTLGYSARSGYFNAGVLVLDLAAWRSLGIEEALFAYAARPAAPTPYIDQDSLNVVFQGRWHPLSPRWNLQTEHFEIPSPDNGIPTSELAETMSQPALVHYTGPCKPWHWRDDHPHREAYFNALAATPFAGFRPRPRSLRDLPPYLFRRLVPRRWRAPLVRALRGTKVA